MDDAGFYIGSIPSRDGSDYDARSGSPSFNQILLELDLQNISGDFVLVIVGKLYTGSDKISGASYVTDVDSVRAAKRDKGSYNQRMANLLGMNSVPQHITGVVIKPY